MAGIERVIFNISHLNLTEFSRRGVDVISFGKEVSAILVKQRGSHC